MGLKKGVIKEVFRGQYWVTKKNNISFGWKHGVPSLSTITQSGLKESTFFLCVVRHPLTWLISLYKRPYNIHKIKNCGNSFSDFIRSPILEFNSNGCVDYFENPIVMWNKKVSSYYRLGALDVQSRIVRYEDVVASPHTFLESIALDLRLPLESNLIPSDSSKNDAGKDTDFYYQELKKDPRRSYEDKDYDFYLDQIDHDLITMLDYISR